MRIGVPKEIKNHEYRVGLTPASVRELCAHGHAVQVQSGAGAAIGLIDDQYVRAGAELASSAEQVYAWAEMIVKVKEPQPNECLLLREGQILYTYLHLAPDPEQTRALMKSGAVCIAYARRVLAASQGEAVEKTIWGSPAGKKRLADRPTPPPSAPPTAPGWNRTPS